MAEENRPLRVGFAMTGSFCTFSAVMKQLEKLAALGWGITPIMSQTSYETDTRFGKAQDFVDTMSRICGKPVLHTLAQVEPIGPKKLLDVIVIAPCTGNTLAKLALGIADTPVTLAVKAHLRNLRPVVVAVSSNDALGAGAKNIGLLMNSRNMFFVPFSKDDPVGKPNSLVAHFDRIAQTVRQAVGSPEPEEEQSAAK